MEFLKSAPGEEPLVVESYFAASPSRVFQAFTDPDMVMQWFGREPGTLEAALIDLRPGGRWQFVLTREPRRLAAFEGEYLVIEPARRLAFSWAHVVEQDGAREATPVSHVEISFSPNGKGTDLRLVHSNLSTEQARRNVGGGWDKSFAAIAAVLERPVPG